MSRWRGALIRLPDLSSLMPLALFFLSGFAALVYETVWTRQLILVFGATLPSASTVLAGFMAGMALGAAAAARWLSRVRRPLALYGWLELAIAAWAALFPAILGRILSFIETTDLPIPAARFVLVFASLLPATVLMGATFPVLTQSCPGPDAGQKSGRLYAANLLGACAGTLGTAFFLLATLGLAGSHWLAVATSAAAGLWALMIRAPAASESRSGAADRAIWRGNAASESRSGAADRAIPRGSAASEGRWRAASPPPRAWALHLCLFISGLCGMAYEVIWMRLLVPSFNNSAYGFASVLFVFLLGLGLGSLAASRSALAGVRSLGSLQLMAGVLAFMGYLGLELTQLAQMRFELLPSSSLIPAILAPLLEVLILLLPTAVLQGAMLPTAARSCAGPENTARTVGTLYSWNTLGGIAGALAAGFWWIPRAGVQESMLLTVLLSLACGGLCLGLSAPRPWQRLALPAGALAAGAFFWWSLRDRNVPQQVLLDWLNNSAVLKARLAFYADDSEASVAVPDRRGGGRHLIINGVGVTGHNNATKMLAHLPLLIHPSPRRVLIICFGMGTTFRSALRHPVAVEAVDLVPSVFKAFPLFFRDARRWTSDARARLIVNDGRNHLLRDRRGYDAILVDPSPPLYAAGTVNLYNRDFFDLARRRLRPGGILAVWLPGSAESEFRMVMKSFLSVLPHVQVWRGSPSVGGVILLGSEAPLSLDRRRAREGLKKPGVREDLLELKDELEDERSFWSLYLGPGERFAEYLADAELVTDDFPRIEYPYFRSKLPSYRRLPSVLRWPPFGAQLGRPPLKRVPRPGPRPRANPIGKAGH